MGQHQIEALLAIRFLASGNCWQLFFFVFFYFICDIVLLAEWLVTVEAKC